MKRDASNALAPRSESVPAERPSVEVCSTRDVVLSDASNALAPRTAFASADDEFDELFFSDEVAAAVLAGCVEGCDGSRGLCRMWQPAVGIIVCGRVELANSELRCTGRTATARCSWRARPRSAVHAMLYAGDAAGATNSTDAAHLLTMTRPPFCLVLSWKRHRFFGAMEGVM